MQHPISPLHRRVRVLIVASFITVWIGVAAGFIYLAIFTPKRICVSVFGSPCPQYPSRSVLSLAGARLGFASAALPPDRRPTRDLDLLGFGDPDPEAMVAVFREICAIKADDAAVFDTGSLTVDRIRDEQEYGGLRLKTTATVDGARVRVVVDVGFGDAVVPGVEEIEAPVLLDQPAPRLRAYPRETVIAEKFQAWPCWAAPTAG